MNLSAFFSSSPGSTNGFQIAAQSDVALAHNDQSVLENHHAFVFFELLRDPDLNIFAQEQVAPPLPAEDSDASATPPSSTPSSGVTPCSGSDSQTPPSMAETGAEAHAGSGTSGAAAPQGGKWSLASYRQFRKMVISAILATDMSKHFDLCRKLDNMEVSRRCTHA